MTASARDVQNAVRDLVLHISPTIVPQTTLTAQATAGATSITVADNSHFTNAGLLFFDDALGESLLTLASRTGTTGITPNFTGTDITGLAHTHTNTTTVYTNLMTEMPLTMGTALNLGDPFIWISVFDEKEYRTTLGPAGLSTPLYSIHIQYHRLLQRPVGQEMDPNRWAYTQQESARADLDTIATTLRNNWTLSGTVLGLGDGKGGPVLTRSWRRLTRDADTQQFVAAMDVSVRGQMHH